MSGGGPPSTPDGRYIVVRGRLWRRANPDLPEEERAALVRALMAARRAVRDADGPEATRLARAGVEAAKRGLGERGPVWWRDGAPDENRRLARNSSYAAWWAGREEDRSGAAPESAPEIAPGAPPGGAADP